MTDEMREYLFVGGPKDGARITTNGAWMVVIPIARPLEVFTKVTPIRRYREPSWDEARYERFGRIYWWDGLIGDAGCSMGVTDQIVAEGGPKLRTVLRHEMRRTLEDSAPGKGLGRIVWRVERGDFMDWKVTALVGPRAVERGLVLRAERRA